MLAGSQVLKSIDQGLKTLRNEVVRLDTELDSLNAQVNQDQRERLQLINEIATVRLDAIESGEVLAELSAADLQVQELLEQRQIALKDLDSAIVVSKREIDSAEQHRENTLALFDKLGQELIDLESAVQSKLEQSASYLTKFKNAKKAESIAEEALSKVERAQLDLKEKAKPYRADDLFMYLWERGYGTTKYSAGRFTRFMDGWVAKTISYEASRANYWNLSEIPKRLAQHAEHVAEKADLAHEELQKIELETLQKAGKAKLESELEKHRDQLDQQDDSLEEKEDELNKMLNQRSDFIGGQDDYSKRCLSRLTRALDHRGIREIIRYTKQTASSLDDKLSRELQSLDDRTEFIDEDQRAMQRLHANNLKHLKELEKVRRQFKDARFDDLRSGFRNESLITNTLDQFMQGAVSGLELWRVIRRNQRHRKVAAMPNFGSGSLGEIADILGEELLRQGRRRQRRHGSTWNFPRPRRGRSGGFRFPSGGGLGGGLGRGGSGGGFKTGGGF